MKTLFLLPIIFLISSSVFAQIYRCEINGQPIYQAGPCQDSETTNMRTLDVPSFRSTTASEDLGTTTEIMNYHNAETINIDKYCRDKNPNNSRVIRYCINSEDEAKSNVDRLRKAPNDILNRCYNKWNTWSMREHCISQEIDARDNVFRLALTASPDLRRRCISEWDTWSMREHCMKK